MDYISVSLLKAYDEDGGGGGGEPVPPSPSWSFSDSWTLRDWIASDEDPSVNHGITIRCDNADTLVGTSINWVVDDIEGGYAGPNSSGTAVINSSNFSYGLSAPMVIEDTSRSFDITIRTGDQIGSGAYLDRKGYSSFGYLDIFDLEPHYNTPDGIFSFNFLPQSPSGSVNTIDIDYHSRQSAAITWELSLLGEVLYSGTSIFPNTWGWSAMYKLPRPDFSGLSYGDIIDIKLYKDGSVIGTSSHAIGSTYPVSPFGGIYPVMDHY